MQIVLLPSEGGVKIKRVVLLLTLSRISSREEEGKNIRVL